MNIVYFTFLGEQSQCTLGGVFKSLAAVVCVYSTLQYELVKLYNNAVVTHVHGT